MTNNMKKIKSYARKVGKSLSKGANSLLDEILPKYQINPDQIPEMQNLHIEIGFGYGDHLYDLALNNPESNFLGAEVYLNGVCNLLKLCKKHPLNNIFVYPGDIDDILSNVKDNSVKEFYIFFPDPWPKTRQKKRRLLNTDRINIIQNKLETRGKMLFITDVENYFVEVKKILPYESYLVVNQDSFSENFINYKPTKYHQLALEESKSIFALTYTKK